MRQVAIVALALLCATPGRAQDAAEGQKQGAPVPAPVVDGVAPVTQANLRRDPMTGMAEVLLIPEPGREALPVVDPSETSAHAGSLRRLAASGAAAGLARVVYDNRDSGHSSLAAGAFPQVSRSRYDAELKERGLHHGVAGRLFFSLPVVGNSSTALTRGPLARSNARLALGDQASAMRSYRLYAANQMYVYPEHRDFDPGTGDRLLAAPPFFIVSQGSSYRDQPFVEALLAVMAALRPDTRERLVAEGLLAPTVQMVLRRTLSGVNGDADYLTPRAHPAVLGRDRLRLAAAVSFANSIRADEIPPMVRLDMQSDFDATPGADYLAGNLGEVLFTTPTAVARVWRSFQYARRLTVSAAETVDPNGRPLRFRWRVLQGDPDRIRITPRGEGARVADIEIAWHDRFTTPGADGIATSRVQIGVFADNGAHVSAPATISVLFPTHQDRGYRAGPDGVRRLETLTHAPTRPEDPYADPSVWPTAGWRDVLRRDAQGRLVGIERVTLATGERRALDRGPLGWIPRAEDGAPSQRHVAVRGADGVLSLTLRPLAGAAGQE